MADDVLVNKAASIEKHLTDFMRFAQQALTTNGFREEA